jgi:hypothetical protein
VTARGRDWVIDRVYAKEGMRSSLEGGVEVRIGEVGRLVVR